MKDAVKMVTLLMVTAMLASCIVIDTSNVSDTGDAEGYYSTIGDDAGSGRMEKYGDRSEFETRYLGYGIDLTTNGYKISGSSVSNKSIFDVSSLKDVYVLKNISKDSTWKEIESTSLSEYLERYSKTYWGTAYAEVSAGFAYAGMSSTSASGLFIESRDSISQYYKTVYYDHLAYTLKIAEQNKNTLQSLISNEFMNDLDSLEKGKISESQIFHKYGTHILSGVDVGGRLDAQYSLTSKTEELTSNIWKAVEDKIYAGVGIDTGIDNIINAELEAGVKFGTATKIDLDEKNNDVKASRIITAMGGSTNITDTKGWIASLDNNTNLTIVGIPSEDSFIPLWDLIPSEHYDASVKLQSYFYKYGYDQYLELCKEYNISSINDAAISFYQTNGDDIILIDNDQFMSKGSTGYIAVYMDPDATAYDIGYNVLNGKSSVVVDDLGNVKIPDNALEQKVVIQVFITDQNGAKKSLGNISFSVISKKFGGGAGTENQPYLIYNYDQLNEIRNSDYANDNNRQFYKLMADINIDSNQTWTPIGGNVTNGSHPRFEGSFDGNGHTVNGLSISWTARKNGSDGHAGMFEIIGSKGEVKNLRLTDVNVDVHRGSADNLKVGAIAGSMYGEGSIHDCHVSGKIRYNCDDNYTTNGETGIVYVGSIIGHIADSKGKVYNCSSDASVSAQRRYVHVGGIAGYMLGGSLSDCNYSGQLYAHIATQSIWDVPGEAYIGGIVARIQNKSNVTVESCVSDSNMQFKDSSTTFRTNWKDYGGIVAKCEGNSSKISNCFYHFNQDGGKNENGRNYGSSVTDENKLRSPSTYVAWNSDSNNRNNPVWHIQLGSLPELKTLNRIELSNGSIDICNSKEYVKGQPIGLNWIKLIAVYNTGYNEEVVPDSIIESSYEGTYIATYMNQKIEFSLKICDISDKGILIISPPNKIVYRVGDTIETDGMVVLKYKNNGESEVIHNYTLSTNIIDNENISEIEIRYGNFTDSFEIILDGKDPEPTYHQLSIETSIDGYNPEYSVHINGKNIAYKEGLIDVENGAAVEIVAASSDEYYFAGWLKDSKVHNSNSISIQMSQDVSLMALFIPTSNILEYINEYGIPEELNEINIKDNVVNVINGDIFLDLSTGRTVIFNVCDGDAVKYAWSFTSDGAPQSDDDVDLKVEYSSKIDNPQFQQSIDKLGKKLVGSISINNSDVLPYDALLSYNMKTDKNMELYAFDESNSEAVKVDCKVGSDSITFNPGDYQKYAILSTNANPTPTNGGGGGGFFDGLCSFILVPLFALIGSAVAIPWWFMRR